MPDKKATGETRALEPVEQTSVTFYEDEITVVLVEDGRRQVYVPLRPLSDLLGVDWSSQRRSVLDDAILGDILRSITVLTAGGPQAMLAIPLDYLQGWLFKINANRVKEEVRPRLLRYQREAYTVLKEAFDEGRLTLDEDFTELVQRDTPAAAAYRIARAQYQLARQQLIMEAKLETHGEWLADHDRRLETLEARLGTGGDIITEAQASRISQAVKAIAMHLGQRTGRNEYGGVYGELYRRYEINSYKHLPAAKFDDAMDWLNEWLQSLTADTPF